MLDDETIQSAVARLVAAATSPSQVIQLGSYAQGSADAGSDLNLLVIEQEISNKAEGYLGLWDAVVGWPLMVGNSCSPVLPSLTTS